MRNRMVRLGSGAAATGAGGIAERVSYPLLLLLGATDAAGYSVIAPVIPDIARASHVGGGITGILVACFGFGQFVGLALGSVTMGRRSTVATLGGALALVMLGDVGFIAGGGLLVYFPARILQGVGAGGLWLGVTIGVVERFPDRGLPRLLGILTAYSVGGILGPALGSLGGIAGPFAAHLVIVMACAAGLGQLGPPRAKVAGDRRAGLRELRSGPFLIASTAVLAVATDLATLEGPLPVHLAVRLSQAQIGSLYAVAAVLLGASAMATSLLSQRKSIAFGVLIASAGIGLLGLTDREAPWIGALALAGVGLGLAEGGALGLLVGSVAEEAIILVTALWSTFWAAGYLFGSSLSGAAVASLGYAAAGVVPTAMAVLALLALARRRP
jgi:predicted MFS family arabinose efflux permease